MKPLPWILDHIRPSHGNDRVELDAWTMIWAMGAGRHLVLHGDPHYLAAVQRRVDELLDRYLSVKAEVDDDPGLID